MINGNIQLKGVEILKKLCSFFLAGLVMACILFVSIPRIESKDVLPPDEGGGGKEPGDIFRPASLDPFFEEE